jgi:hypothetical protein
MENQNPTAEAPKKKSFFRKPLGCLLTLFVGGLLFLILLVVFGIWFAGSNQALKIASDFVNTKSGGELKFAENDTNLFAGRVHYKGIELTNPSRFTDKQFVKINEIKAVVNIGSAASDTIIIPEVIMDIGTVSLVGSDDWMHDNNAMDFKKAFAPAAAEETKPDEPKPEEPKPETKEEGPKKHFRIGKLVLKLDRIRVLEHGTTAGETAKPIVDDAVGLNWVFEDVSDENIKEKVYAVVQNDIAKLGGKFANIALAMGTAALGKELGNLGKQGTDLINKGAGEATKAVDDAAKSITDGIGGFLGGDKKKK